MRRETPQSSFGQPVAGEHRGAGAPTMETFMKRSSVFRPVVSPPRSLLRGGATLLLAAGLFIVGRGDEVPPAKEPGATEPEAVVGKGIFPAGPSASFGDEELLIPEVFQSHLPTTLQKHRLRLRLNPHIDDLRNKDHMRLSTGLRFGVTENWEIGAGSDLYFSHGRGEIRSFERYGAANLQLSTKLNLGQPWSPRWNVGVGFDYVMPIDRPPAELTDGLRHFKPYITFSHRLEKHRDIRVFCGFRLDLISVTDFPGQFGKNAFHESSSGVTGGWVIDRKNLHYTFEAEFDTTRLIGHSSEDVFTLRPGVVWEIVSRKNPLARGHWVIGTAVKCTFGPGGTSVGGSLRVRYSRDFKIPLRSRSAIPVP